MGKELRKAVENQLLNDLKVYGVDSNDLKFNWSESCIEGHRAKYLDGALGNYSDIKLFGENYELIVDGWLEYIYEKDQNIFLVYWDFLDVYYNGKAIVKKGKVGIPNHLLNLLIDNLKDKYKELLRAYRLNRGIYRVREY